MKHLKDFENDINNCSKCGKCQEICPIYKLTGNDCAVSRGKFAMLSGVLKGDLTLNKTIEKYLDMCLKCGKCNDFCPSGIDICEILNTAKAECVKNTKYAKITKFLQSKKVFNTFLNFFNNRIPNNLTGNTKLLYFAGCVNKIYPKAKNAIRKVLSHYDVELIEKDFDCCGLPFLSSGNLERFEEAKEHNLELLKGDYNYIITDCASCESVLQSYGIENVVNICHFLAIQNKKFLFKKPLKITFHKPCHLKSDAFLKPLLDKCENIEYIQAKDYDECCGFSGEFALHNPKLSFKMTRQKAKNLAETGADIILTACPACIMGIHQGMILNNIFGDVTEQHRHVLNCLLRQGKRPSHYRIMNIIEFLAMADEIF